MKVITALTSDHSDYIFTNLLIAANLHLHENDFLLQSEPSVTGHMSICFQTDAGVTLPWCSERVMENLLSAAQTATQQDYLHESHICLKFIM